MTVQGRVPAKKKKKTKSGGYNIIKKKLRGFSPPANYTDRAIAAGQRS
jgi:hypothetical protein